MSKAQRPLYLFLLVVVLLNTVLWLDSFDRYLGSRYHITLSAAVPEGAFALSRQTQDLIAKAQQFTSTKLSQLVTPAQRNDAPASPKLTATVSDTGPATQTNEGTTAAPTTALETPGSVAAPAPVVAPAPAATAAVTASAPSVPPTSNVMAVTHQRAATDVAAPPITFPKILFAGDSMMQGVAPLVINQLRKENPKGVFVDLSAQSTGLTVRRYFDWPTKIKDETLSRGFELIAIFLGPNDPWDIYEGAKRFVFGTPEWEDKYRDRVIEVMQFAQDRQVHVIWIGLPNMKEDRVKRGAIVQNKIFREQASQFNFDYLSTEDLLGGLDEPFKKFVNEPGKGQVMLRADDGIHFTHAGLRLISNRLYELIKKQAKP